MNIRIRSRSKLLWFGAPPTEEEYKEVNNRGLDVQYIHAGEKPDFSHARGALYRAISPHLRLATKHLVYVPQALAAGLYVHIEVREEVSHDHVIRIVHDAVPEGPLRAHMRVRIGSTGAHEAAELIARHDPGPAANDSLEVDIDGDAELTAEQTNLIRRAFFDCKAVTLQPLTGGKSAKAFAVQATLAASQVGPRPMPFFAKLDTARKILAERHCYQQYADNHIPWYLRPNLQPDRCVLGLESGILVGSFVARSESLWQAILDGRGTKYIQALFEETLLGWRSQSDRNTARLSNIAGALPSVFVHARVPELRVERARQFGEVATPFELWEMLLNLPEMNWREAPMHGDMHAENVRVRNNDAIIIDLAKTSNGPLCADLASLEVWLSFQIPPASKGNMSPREWQLVMDELYAPTAFDLLEPASVDSGADWLRSCVQQIRSIAGDMCRRDEYMTVVALYLLRRASFGADAGREEEDDHRRNYAYWLGGRLINALAISADAVKEMT